MKKASWFRKWPQCNNLAPLSVPSDFVFSFTYGLVADALSIDWDGRRSERQLSQLALQASFDFQWYPSFLRRLVQLTDSLTCFLFFYLLLNFFLSFFLFVCQISSSIIFHVYFFCYCAVDKMKEPVWRFCSLCAWVSSSGLSDSGLMRVRLSAVPYWARFNDGACATERITDSTRKSTRHHG